MQKLYRVYISLSIKAADRGALLISVIIKQSQLSFLNTTAIFFLEKCGAGDWMRDVLAKIVANRPEDPIAVLAQ